MIRENEKWTDEECEEFRNLSRIEGRLCMYDETPDNVQFVEGSDIMSNGQTLGGILERRGFTKQGFWRLKKEPEYISFKFSDWEEFLNKIVLWKDSGVPYVIKGCDKKMIYLDCEDDVVSYNYEDAIINFVFPDGKHFGKLAGVKI